LVAAVQGPDVIRVRRAAVATAAALAVVLAALATRGVAPASAGTEPFAVEALTDTFDSPVYAEAAPKFDDLLFVVERAGEIDVLRDEVKRPKPFLDIKNRVDTDGENGLLSVAFPLDYKKSRRFYVFYTDNGGDIRVDEFKRRRGNELRADADSRRRVIRIPHPGCDFHNGGTVAFGIKGSEGNPNQAPRLWLGTGDGCKPDNARDITKNLLGKILRILPFKANKPNAPGYGIPGNNRFVGRRGDDEIYAYGLRNPFRFSFDHERNAISIGDVGESAEEEINYYDIASNQGSNLGWPEFEGNSDHGGTPGPHPAKPPMHTYANPNGGGSPPAAVTGGVVIRDPDLGAELDGTYVFADFYAGDLFTFTPDLVAQEPVDPPADSGVDVSQPAAFTTGANKQIYITSLAGTVYKLEPAT
jgi:glucose/arabinose dehydrogenase